ncbi:MAG: ACP S-malonyltransferase [Alphaproteobacteria bacterium]|nr:ACP S-malonyltransferase [Alphaproteobacteria bacterium]
MADAISGATTGRIFVFPGQGSQTVGMGKDLAEAFPAAAAVFEQVDEALGERLSRLMFEGPEDQLTLTANAQPALMAVSLASLRAIESEAGRVLGELCDVVAGHSLGEYSALAAADTLDIATAAKLLRLRGESMQKAVPVGAGAMAALIGVDLDVAASIAQAAAEGQVCDIANDNGGGQVVLSGDVAAIDRALALAPEHGVRRALKLPVSAPFHCALMAPAADVMSEALAATVLRVPAVPLLANITAAVSRDPDVIRRQLVEQVTGRVRWRESMEALPGLRVTSLVELGAGKVLSGLVRRIDKAISSSAVGTPEEVRGFIETLV